MQVLGSRAGVVRRWTRTAGAGQTMIAALGAAGASN